MVATFANVRNPSANRKSTANSIVRTATRKDRMVATCANANGRVTRRRKEGKTTGSAANQRAGSIAITGSAWTRTDARCANVNRAQMMSLLNSTSLIPGKVNLIFVDKRVS